MELDQGIRQQWIEDRSEEEEVAYSARFTEIDADNTAWLRAVVVERGWPLLSQVGEDGAQAAWLLAQHADASPEIQREFHVLLIEAVGRQEGSPRYLGYLEDRVRVNSGRPQLYGTQFIDDGDGLLPRPIEDPDGLAERRAAVGMEPFEEYEATMHAMPVKKG